MQASRGIPKCHFRISGHHSAEASGLALSALPVRKKAHTTIAKDPPPSAGPFSPPLASIFSRYGQLGVGGAAIVSVIGLTLDTSGPGLSRSLSDAALASQVLAVPEVPAC